MPMKPGTLGDWIAYAAMRLSKARLHFGHGTHNAAEEAAWLVQSVAGIPYDRLAASLDTSLTPAQQRRAEKLIEERIGSRAPLAYLLHEAWLGEERFYVDRRVIVPRSFIAELLPKSLAPWIVDPKRIRRALDLCTGSGCLAVLLALAFPQAKVDAIDISPAALVVARRNVRAYGLESRVRLLRSDLFAGLAAVPYEVIVANPPYVNARGVKHLPLEYRHEPALALAGGRDGLDFVRRIINDAPGFLAPRGLLIVEVGHNRKALERVFPSLPFTWLQTSRGDGFVFLLAREDLTRH
ncbi:MAG: 50S ribosomal protein L3 N(5)-glutamine methyltransferase [Betaproteobacteria bacterium]|nr:50S ribosomal protein L3 N(5)-glutamine methyltransferase [Betaproteobacteria bacterium]